MSGLSDGAQDTVSREELGARLRAAREYLGFTQEDIAEYLGIARSALSLIEAGRRRVDALELKKLASIYQRPLGSFTGEIDSSILDEEVRHIARKVAELAPEDRNELAQFAEFLQARRQRRDQ